MSARRRVVLPALLVLAACAGSPPVRWYELRATPPEPAVQATAPADAAVWSFSPTVALPGALDRDTLLVAHGDAGLEPLPGHRWAEPLRDSVPRLLLADLRRLRGAERVWPAPPPAGVRVAQRLVVALDQLQVQPDRRSLRLAARATWQDPAAEVPPVLRTVAFEVPIEGDSADAIAGAHRTALWRLAQRLALGPSAP